MRPSFLKYALNYAKTSYKFDHDVLKNRSKNNQKEKNKPEVLRPMYSLLSKRLYSCIGQLKSYLYCLYSMKMQISDDKGNMKDNFTLKLFENLEVFLMFFFELKDCFLKSRFFFS